MRYTPVELRHVKPSKSFRGYDRAEVDRLVQDVADSFEEVWRDRGELADKLEDLEKALSDVRQREALLASTLVAAEKTAAEAIENAKREAEVIIAEAHHESRSITRTAQAERERLFAETRRVETLLRAALGMVEETTNEPSATQPVAPSEDSWPHREHTREFQAVQPESVPSPPSASSSPPAPPESPASPEPARLPPVQPEVAADEPEDDGPWAARDFAWG